MIRPYLFARVEQLGDLVSIRINACQVGTLMEVAAVAGKREIFKIISATVLSCPDMLDV